MITKINVLIFLILFLYLVSITKTGVPAKKIRFFNDFMPVLYADFMFFYANVKWNLCLIYDFFGNFMPYFMKMFQKMLEKQKQRSYSLMTILQCTLPIWRIKINKRTLYCVKQTRQSNKYALKKINRSFKYFYKIKQIKKFLTQN